MSFKSLAKETFQKVSFLPKLFIISLSLLTTMAKDARECAPRDSLHWTLDVTFSEDKSRIRKDNAPENFALLRRLALNLLKQEKSFKGSLKMKRYKASMDNDYLTQILASSAS